MPAGDTDYEAHGTGYATHRRADPRFERRVHAALGDAATVVNVGAGAGSYEPTDRRVVAVEPSAAMRAQRPPGAAPVVDAVAEALSFPDGAFQAAMAMITVHQWRHQAAGLRELRRVATGPVVVLTFDAPELGRSWIAEYAPEVVEVETRRFPPIHRICEVLGGTARVEAVPIPLDCTDGFAEAFYGRPEALLDPAVRAGHSSWLHTGPEVEARAVARLADDLRSGRWDERHGHLRHQPTYDGSVRLVVASPS